MQIDAFFKKFGLTENEKNIYIFLLNHGAAIASIIGKRLKIKRVTVYAILESLGKKNMVSTFHKNKVTYFEAVSPEEIIAICKKQTDQAIDLETEAKNLFPKLKQMEVNRLEPVIEVKGKIKYYQGLEAVKSLVDETLEEKEAEQLCFGLNKYHTNHLKEDWAEYTKKRIGFGMHVRSIQPSSPIARNYKKRDKSELRRTHLVPAKKFLTNCELNIIGDMIALFSTHGDEPTGMKIYNKEMAQNLRSLFELAWEKAEDYDQE